MKEEKKASRLRIIKIILTVYVLYRLVNVILITGIYYAGQERIKSDLAACGADECFYTAGGHHEDMPQISTVLKYEYLPLCQRLAVPESIYYSGHDDLGHGIGYRYAHNYPKHYVKQQYLPDELVGEHFYEPGELGYEAEIRRHFAFLAEVEQVQGDAEE